MTIRRLTGVLLAVALIGTAITTPTASASETECVTVEIDHIDGSPLVESRQGTTEILTSIVGHFVWFSWGDVDDFDSLEAPDTLSFDVSDPTVERAIGCTDGSVEIVHAQPEAPTEAPADDPAPEPTPEPTTTPLTPYCEVHPDTLARYCDLGNQVLVIS